MSDFTKTMAPETAVKKARAALSDQLDGVDNKGAADAVATLAAAMLINEGLIALAKATVPRDEPIIPGR